MDMSRSPSRDAAQEVTSLSAVDLARRIASGGLSAREAVEAHIRRIETVNPRLNALVVPLFEQAMAQAAAADAGQARGETLGPLHGVPFTVKESFDVAGAPTTLGLKEKWTRDFSKKPSRNRGTPYGRTLPQCNRRNCPSEGTPPAFRMNNM